MTLTPAANRSIGTDDRAKPLDAGAVAAAANALAAGAGLRLERAEPLTGGRSSTTIELRLRDGDNRPSRAVLHVEPRHGPHAGITSAHRQYELLRALADSEIPVPPAVCVSARDATDRFLVTGWIDGEAPDLWRADGRAFIVEAEARAPGVLAEEFARVLVRIHGVPLDSLPASALPGPDEPQSPARRELARWTPGIEASTRFAGDPVLVYGRRWLEQYEPPPSPAALVHGDYRVGNIVFGDHRIVAVLDWELARVGDPLLDVAMVCAPPLRVAGLAGGLWEPAAFVTRYGELAGRPVDPVALAYYTVMATFKVAALWVRASERFAAGEPDPASLRAGFSVLETRRMLVGTLGLGSPADHAGERLPHRPGAPALNALRAILLEEVLPHVRDGHTREQLVSVRSILRYLADAPGPAQERAFDERLATGLAELEPVVPGLGTRLGPAVDAAFDRFGAATHAMPELAPLRDLVAAAAELPLGMWP